MQTCRQLLLKARELINAGWCQRYFYRCVDGKKEYCMTGSLDAAERFDPQRNHLHTEIAASAYQSLMHAAGTARCLSSWNDQSERTKEEVLAVFDKAIAAQPEDTNDGS